MDAQLALQFANGRIAERHCEALAERLARAARVRVEPSSPAPLAWAAAFVRTLHKSSVDTSSAGR